MARLPIPGGDEGHWGQILNDFLAQAHQSDGTLQNGVVTSTAIADNAITEAKFDANVQSKLNSGANFVQNMVISNTKVTTQWWPSGGANGPIAAAPTWGTLGNTKSNNIWADGPNGGQSAF